MGVISRIVRCWIKINYHFCDLQNEMASIIKRFDENFKEFKRLKASIRNTVRTGLNDKNSFDFFIRIDRIQQIIPQLAKRYKDFHVPDDINHALESFG